MEKRFDVIAMGELLIDFTMNGQSEQGNNLFEACPGGAPCNVLAMLNKLGKKTAFLGKVGDDQFGRLLRDTISSAGIDASNLLTDDEVNTTLAFVHTFPDGDREFSFYRNPGADMMLREEEVEEDFIRQARLFHFGNVHWSTNSGNNVFSLCVCQELSKESVLSCSRVSCKCNTCSTVISHVTECHHLYVNSSSP